MGVRLYLNADYLDYIKIYWISWIKMINVLLLNNLYCNVWKTAYTVNLFWRLCSWWTAEFVLHHKALREQLIKCYFRNILWCVLKKKYSQLYIAWQVSWCVATSVIVKWLREDLREGNSVFRENYLGWFQVFIPGFNLTVLSDTLGVQTLCKNLRLKQGILFKVPAGHNKIV